MIWGPSQVDDPMDMTADGNAASNPALAGRTVTFQATSGDASDAWTATLSSVSGVAPNVHYVDSSDAEQNGVPVDGQPGTFSLPGYSPGNDIQIEGDTSAPSAATVTVDDTPSGGSTAHSAPVSIDWLNAKNLSIHLNTPANIADGDSTGRRVSRTAPP